MGPDRRRVFSILIWASVLVGVVLIAALFPRILAVYYSYYGQDSIEKIFYEASGLDAPLSKVLAVPFALLYGLAWVFVIGWAGAVVRWKLDLNKFLITLPFFIIFYALAPAAQLVIGTPCFNQRDGTPQKWYVIGADGKVILYNSPGFDPETGAQKVPVTREICRISSDQKRGLLPRKISDQAATERDPNVWYALNKDQIELFDREGIHPRTLQPLQPVTAEVLAPVKARLARAQAQAEKERLQAIKEQEAKERAEQIEQDRQARAAQIEQDRLDKLGKEQQAAKDRAAIASLKRRTQDSHTGFECTIGDDGVYFPIGSNGEAELVPFTNLRVVVDRVQWYTSVLFFQQIQTAIVVNVVSSNKQCLAYAISPAPAYPEPYQLAAIDNVADALSTLGAEIAQRILPNPPPPAQNPTPLQVDSYNGGGTIYGGSIVGGSSIGGASVIRGGGTVGGGTRHSDIQLKEDIVAVSRLTNGITLYRFQYKGDDHTAYVGVLAQEVQSIVPSAVTRGRDGYLLVDYDELGLAFMTWDEWIARSATQYQEVP